MEQRLRTLLCNAIALLVDQTFEQYDNTDEWKSMIENELGCTMDELRELGVYILI